MPAIAFEIRRWMTFDDSDSRRELISVSICVFRIFLLHQTVSSHPLMKNLTTIVYFLIFVCLLFFFFCNSFNDLDIDCKRRRRIFRGKWFYFLNFIQFHRPFTVRLLCFLRIWLPQARRRKMMMLRFIGRRLVQFIESAGKNNTKKEKWKI